ncbi:type III polyketide synthase [Aurantiacibacter zhengii]|uniref:Type III polyketide synthase n=1 Tax=Aurantiacibacter zhengii TaxID=2307003 RepID=A0A418NWY6_9SPHN|nr:type III polyketide synthase [Aurantiacibacter zhengii]RIV89123.1 type III polyketide synthase [Aurantiacibacter zhengii]
MSRTIASNAPRINAIATAVPECDVHTRYTEWAASQLDDERKAKLFRRMESRGGISHRYSVLSGKDAALDFGSFYMREEEPGTRARMERYAAHAPDLAMQAIAGLPSTEGVTHLVVASCTGFLAPGLDQIIARRLGLAAGVERVSIGFMGCYAGVTLLRTAAHIVRSDPSARVLAVAVELCSLHLQQSQDIQSLLAMGQFADGAAAVLLSADGEGLALGQGLSLALEESGDLITWTIGNSGFVMHLSGEVPGKLGEALDDPAVQETILGENPPTTWAVHPGGRSVLDAVERGLALPPDALDASRGVLDEFGNMSSATVLFVLDRLAPEKPASGIALAFGPGLAMEGVRFGWIGSDA